MYHLYIYIYIYDGIKDLYIIQLLSLSVFVFFFLLFILKEIWKNKMLQIMLKVLRSATSNHPQHLFQNKFWVVNYY